MPVTRQSTLPTRRGEADAQNFKDRVRKQLAKALRDNIGKEDIITGEGKIKVPLKGTKRWRFIEQRPPEGEGGSGGAGLGAGEEEYEVWLDMEEVEEILFQELELPRLKPKKEAAAETLDYKFNTWAKKGPLIDKKATLKKNLEINAAKGQPGIGDFNRDHLRYISYHDTPRPKSKAVIFLMMDVSASMSEYHKRVARLFFYWVVRFLKRRYDQVDIRFIAHTEEAKEVTEHQFFNRVESGGTAVSSAYKLAHDMIQMEYPANDWNIYVLHASDGDNWKLDNDEVFSLIKRLCRVASMVGYLEIRHALYGGGWSTLMDDLGPKRAELGEEFMLYKVKAENEIWPAIKHFFRKDQVEESIV